MPEMVAHDCEPRTWGVRAGESEVQGHLEQGNELLASLKAAPGEMGWGQEGSLAVVMSQGLHILTWRNIETVSFCKCIMPVSRI